MGETDEFAPQSLHAENEPEQAPTAEESAEPTTDAPAELIVEQAEDVRAEPVTEPAELPIEEYIAVDDAQSETAVEPTELDEISQSLSDENDSDGVAGDDDAIDDAGTADDAVTEAGSFDDIAPPVPAAGAASQPPEPSAAAGQVPWWPFLAYLGAWVVLAAAAVWQILQLPADQVVYESTAYVLTILGGLIMTATGPLLILAVWIGIRANRPPQERAGLLTSALMKGALVTLGGAIIWWASLVIIDYLRLGRLL